MKALLSDLSSALLKFHRGLLVYQTDLVEKVDGRKYLPYDLLNLSLNDSRFSWLRKFSDLIVQIDTIVDDKKNTPFDAFSILTAAKKIVSLDSASEKNEMLLALQADSSIMIPLGQVRKCILALESALKENQT